MGIGLSSVALLLGCDNDGIDAVEETANELEETHAHTVEELNLLLQEEAELQAHFDETLESDDDLTTFGDGSSPVFTNLSDRRERVEQLNDLEEEYVTHAESLNEYEGEQLEANDLDGLAEEATQFSETLGTFNESYEQNIDAQENYFEGLAAEEATYETFSDGINELNDQYENTREQLYTLDEELSSLAQGIEDLQQNIQATQEEGEE